MGKSKIDWTEKVWNPVTGCSKVSQGCKNCYAEAIANRFWGKQTWYEFDTKHGSITRQRRFTDVMCHEDRLSQPIHWKKPARIFVNSMSDLFHEDVPFDFVDEVLRIIAVCPQHTFQILTKRPNRMKQYIEQSEYAENIEKVKNVWLGVSVEDQKTADERIPVLLRTSSYVRWLSVEPMLGPVNLDKYDDEYEIHWLTGLDKEYPEEGINMKIDWVVVGGESGPNARPMHPDWVRSIRDQCKAADVPFFFKQWGTWIGSYDAGYRSSESGYYNNGMGDNWVRHYFRFPDGQGMVKTGKKKAGYLLDGKQYREYPNEMV